MITVTPDNLQGKKRRDIPMATTEELNKIWFKSQKRVKAKLLERPMSSLGFPKKDQDSYRGHTSITELKPQKRPSSAIPGFAAQPSSGTVYKSWSKTSSLLTNSSQVPPKKVHGKKPTKITHHGKKDNFTRTVYKKGNIQHKDNNETSARTKKSIPHILFTGTKVISNNVEERHNDNSIRFIDQETEAIQSKHSSSPPQKLESVCEVIEIENYNDPKDKFPWPVLTNNLLEEEGGYDTDIEVDFKEKPPDNFDMTGKMLYLSLCKENELVPVSYFVKLMDKKRISMRHHGLGSKGAKTIASALVKNTVVEELDLRDNFLEPEGGMALAEMLHENFFITELDLSDNFLHARAGVALANVLRVNSSLKKLLLQGNHFTDRVAKEFADVLKENRTLKYLDLSYNEFGEQGGLFLGAGLALNYGLEVLIIKWNSIRGKGGVSMAAALKTNDSLKHLDVSWNGLAFVGALALSRHMRKNETLEELDISNNRIGPKGAVKFSPVLKNHPKLQIFKIGLNPIGDEGVESVLNAAKKNDRIKIIGLDDITVSPTVFQEICELQKARDIVITTGGLGGFAQRKPPPSGMEILVQFMQDNRIRLKDLFFQFDKDHSGDITREEFKHGLKETGIKMSEKQLDALIEKIDIDKNNLIEYSEVLFGREQILKERRFQRKVAIRTKEREKASIALPKLAGFEE